MPDRYDWIVVAIDRTWLRVSPVSGPDVAAPIETFNIGSAARLFFVGQRVDIEVLRVGFLRPPRAPSFVWLYNYGAEQHREYLVDTCDWVTQAVTTPAPVAKRSEPTNEQIAKEPVW